MKEIFRHISRGAGRLPNYGEHPGTGILVIMLIIGSIAGEFAGFLLMLLFWGPIWAYGAYSRSKGDQ